MNIQTFALSILIVIAAALGYAAGFSNGIDRMKRDAIIGGYAEWQHHELSGKPVFFWK